jgi:hypothetical protein
MIESCITSRDLSSAAVHGVVRPLVAARTAATSSAVTADALFPKALRT